MSQFRVIIKSIDNKGNRSIAVVEDNWVTVWKT